MPAIVKDTKYTVRHPYVRGMYIPTPYFNSHYPDQYTYLQYWRRRMCYGTYLNYYDIHFKNGRHLNPNCMVWDRIVNYTSYPLPKNKPLNHQHM